MSVLGSIGWTGASATIRQMLSFLLTVILARLLAPADFGLFAMAVVFSGLLNPIRDLGLPHAIIRHPGNPTKVQLSSVFWLNMAMAIGIVTLILLVAPLLAAFFNEPRVTGIARWFALAVPIRALGAIHKAMLTRRLQFREVAITEIAASAVGTTAGVWAAFEGAGVWSFVVQAISTAFVSSAALWLASRWLPALKFSLGEVKDMLSFGGYLVGVSIIGQIHGNADRIIIGRLLGANALGIYGIAWRGIRLPRIILGQTIGRVMFPALSRLQSRQQALRTAVLLSVEGLVAVGAPLFLGLAAIAPTFVMVLFGENWLASVVIMQILAGLGLLNTVFMNFSWVFQAKGRADLYFRNSAIASIVTLTALTFGAMVSLEAAALAYLLGTLLVAYPLFRVPMRLATVSWMDLLGRVGPGLLIASIMAAVVYAVDWYLAAATGLPPAVRLLGSVVTGVFFYACLMWIFRRNAIKNILEHARTHREEFAA